MFIPLDRVKEIDKIRSFEDRVYEAAKLYANADFMVIPIRPMGKAIPEKVYNITYSHATSKLSTIEKWFHPHTGKFSGWNIGLACGRSGGIFVVDLDLHGGEQDGVAEWASLQPDKWEYAGPVQETPSGGKHLVFQWREHAVSSSGKIANGIDTRGGDHTSCKSHIVVWPSNTPDGDYRWTHGGEVYECPDWVIDKMGKSWQSKRGGNRGNEYVDIKDVEDKFEAHQIRDMLEYINPDELTYDEWLQVGLAIHSQFPDDLGFGLWDEWSKPGDRYDPKECVVRWNGFDQGGDVRIGTLIYHAQKRGFQGTDVPEPRQDEIDDIVSALNKEFAIVPMGSDVFVLQEHEVVKELARIQPSYTIFKKTGFKSLLENTSFRTMGEKGPTKKTHAELWLGHPERRTYPYGVGMFPGKPKRYHGYYNLWNGFMHEPKKGDWGLFRDHIKDIMCDGNEDYFHWTLDWMADLYQDPANPKGTAIILSGIEGCGKGTFAQFIGEPFGVAFKHITDQEHLTGRFNAHMMDSVVVFADEVTYGGDKKVAGKLKALATERFITGEKKGIDAIQFRNCAHLVVASNESWFIPAGPQSRRWFVLECSPKMANNREYFSAMHAQMEERGGFEAMMHELLGRKITSNLQKAPETEGLFRQRGRLAAGDSMNRWWSQKLTLGVSGLSDIKADIGEDNPWPSLVTKSDLIQDYWDWCKENSIRFKTPDDAFYKDIIKYGLSASRPSVNGSRIYAYKLPRLEEARVIFKEQTGIDLIEKEE